jgi:hypothetical protein
VTYTTPPTHATSLNEKPAHPRPCAHFTDPTCLPPPTRHPARARGAVSARRCRSSPLSSWVPASAAAPSAPLSSRPPVATRRPSSSSSTAVRGEGRGADVALYEVSRKGGKHKHGWSHKKDKKKTFSDISILADHAAPRAAARVVVV